MQNKKNHIKFLYNFDFLLIPDFDNLGYQEEIINLFKKIQRLQEPITIISIPT